MLMIYFLNIHIYIHLSYIFIHTHGDFDFFCASFPLLWAKIVSAYMTFLDL